jgi:transposase
VICKRRGNIFLTTALVQAALAGSRKKRSYLKDKYWRLRVRRGHKRAVVAVAHRLLIAAYHMLRDSVDYTDLGEGYLDQRSPEVIKRKLVKRLELLAYKVSAELAA